MVQNFCEYVKTFICGVKAVSFWFLFFPRIQTSPAFSPQLNTSENLNANFKNKTSPVCHILDLDYDLTQIQWIRNVNPDLSRSGYTVGVLLSNST